MVVVILDVPIKTETVWAFTNKIGIGGSADRWRVSLVNNPPLGRYTP